MPKGEVMISLKRILMATDFSDYSKEALDYAVYLAKTIGADLYLLHVYEIPMLVIPGETLSVRTEVYEWLGDLKEDTAKSLEAQADKVRHQGVQVHPILKEGHPFREILNVAQEISADLIVLGTHGRTGLPHVLLGSVAERVVRKASCPVFTVRPKALAPEKKTEE